MPGYSFFRKAALSAGTAIILILAFSSNINAQTPLIIERQTFTNSDETWEGVNIPRSEPTRLNFKNNIITSSNTIGYMLQAGDENENISNHNLDSAIITGNKLIWKGTDNESITHGIFTGHNSNVVMMYNYLDHVPMGLIRKSTNNMSNTGGGVAYNIVKGGAVAAVVKGMSNVNIFNNTFYGDRKTSETWRPLLDIYTNVDDDAYSVAHGTTIYNNIFYTRYQTFAIAIDDKESLNGLKCDYNIYWCENGKPVFNINGSVKTFAQWQAMGFDKHSHIFNPKFKDLENFVPASRLDFGVTLGEEWVNGLSINAKWELSDPVLTAQNGKWQVGAVIYGEDSTLVPVKDDIFISPNPAQDHINILNMNILAGSHSVRIYDLAGVLKYETVIFPGDNNQIQIDLRPGIYVLQISFNTSTKFSERLVVIR